MRPVLRSEHWVGNRYVTVRSVRGGYRWSLFATVGAAPGRRVHRLVCRGWAFTEQGALRAAMRRTTRRARWEPYRRRHHRSIPWWQMR